MHNKKDEKLCWKRSRSSIHNRIFFLSSPRLQSAHCHFPSTTLASFSRTACSPHERRGHERSWCAGQRNPRIANSKGRCRVAACWVQLEGIGACSCCVRFVYSPTRDEPHFILQPCLPRLSSERINSMFLRSGAPPPPFLPEPHSTKIHPQTKTMLPFDKICLT